MPQPDEVLATIQASTPRRFFGVAVLASLGLFLTYVALVSPPANPLWGFFLIFLGAGNVWAALRMWRATEGRIELTETQVRASDGTVIAEIADIRSLDRGMFAFKPSNGFMLRLNKKAPRRWWPGLWWCLGDRVGVGGVTSAGQTKAMAEIISAMLAQR